MKLRIYSAGVLSILTYGSECWKLNEACCKKIGAWHARRMAFITGREIAEEYKNPTYPLLDSIRARRLKWAGHLLRADANSLPRKLAMAELEEFPPCGKPDGIFMDVPRLNSSKELVECAQDRDLWRGLVENIHKAKTNTRSNRKGKPRKQSNSETSLISN